MRSWLFINIFYVFQFSLILTAVGHDKPLTDTIGQKISTIPDKYLSQVQHKSQQIEGRLNRKTDKTLARLIRQEKKMKHRLTKIDPIAAKNIFEHSIDSLNTLKAGLNRKVMHYTQALNGSYNGYLDTLQGSLKFIKESEGFLVKSKAKLTNATQSVQLLEDKLQQAEHIKTYIRERRQQLKNQLAGYTGFTKDLQRINKEAYYYSQQLNEYKSLLKDRKKAEATAIKILRKIPAYNDFLKNNSRLAELFNLPSGGSDLTQDLQGLQTRMQVEQLIQGRLGSSQDARRLVSQQMDQARAQFSELKNKFLNVDNIADMPDFKPNEMKTKSLIQRLEFGGNIQFQRSNNWYPATSDLAGQVAYKFHKDGSAGLGMVYKLGLGKDLDHIAFSNSGIGIRSFVDWKLKKTFYINGGFEQNYNKVYGWQGSALLGISKKYKINNKLKGNVILLYDLLSSHNVPRTDPIKLRMGYNL